MADNELQDTVTIGDFLAEGGAAPRPGEGAVTYDEFMGVSSPSAAAPTVIPRLPEEHRGRFIQEVADGLYDWGLNSALTVAGGVVSGVAAVNNFANHLTGLSNFKKYQEATAGGPAELGGVALQSVPQDNAFARAYYGVVGGIASMAPTLPVDIMTGQLFTRALAGRVLPSMMAMMERIPDFAIGGGLRSFVDEVSTSGDFFAGAEKGVETATWNSLYATAGGGLKGIGKMTSLGVASVIYDAAREGRLPTKDEMIDGAAQGLGFGLVFTMLPHIMEATKVAPERAALKEYAEKIDGLSVYRGGTSPGTWYTPDRTAAQEYADFSGGSVTSHSLPKGKIAEKSDILRIAKEVGAKPDQALYWLVSPENSKDAPKILAQLKAEGYDAVHLPKGEDFSPGGREIESYKVFSPLEVAKSPEEIIGDIFSDARIRPETKEVLAKPFFDRLEERGAIVPPDLSLGRWKDPSTLSMLRETMERNIEGAAKADAVAVKNFSTERIKENETFAAKWQTQYRTLLESKIAEWGIKPKSPEDAFVMRLGEKRMTLEELKAQTPNWERVVIAEKWFREQYDSLLSTINTVRTQYGYPEIERRDDYFRHFQELDGASRMFGMLYGGAKVPTAIAGVVRRVKSGKPFTSVEMERKGGAFVESAIGGFDNYLKVARDQIFHTDSVQRIRALENYIRVQSETNDKVDLANFLTNAQDYANLLAGQPIDFDRAAQRFIGRPAYGVLRWMDRRTAANMIGANVSAAAMNTIVLATQAPVTINPLHLSRGVLASVMTPFNTHFFKIEGVESELFTRRYPKHRIALDFWSAAADNSQAFFQAIDMFSVKSILAGAYFQARAEGLSPTEAMKKADNATSRMVTDRSKGQLPLLMESKSLRVVTRFQTEVNNMISWLQKDVPQEMHGDVKKTVGALAMFSVYSFAFNSIMEELTGRRPTIDPIHMLGTLAGMTKEGKNRPFSERIYPALEEAVGQLPFGNLLVEGGRFPVAAAIPNMWKMAENPTLGTVAGELSRPVFYLGMPFGGGQAKKTLDGMVEYARGRSETPSGDERYIIHRDFANFMRGFMFGKNSFPEAVRYWAQPADER